jgi:hypothetical protein
VRLSSIVNCCKPLTNNEVTKMNRVIVWGD